MFETHLEDARGEDALPCAPIAKARRDVSQLKDSSHFSITAIASNWSWASDWKASLRLKNCATRQTFAFTLAESARDERVAALAEEVCSAQGARLSRVASAALFSHCETYSWLRDSASLRVAAERLEGLRISDRQTSLRALASHAHGAPQLLPT